MKWTVWHNIKVVVLWVVCSVFVGGAIFLIARHDGQLIKDSSLDVERPTSAPATSTVTASKEPVVVVVPAATNEPRYAASNLYAEAGVVTELDYTADMVTFMDARGMYWSFYGVEDWQVGDLLCAILYDAGTFDPLDDAVIGVTYHAGAY